MVFVVLFFIVHPLHQNDKEATRVMIYRNDPYLDAQFQKAVQAAHDQDWDTF